MGRWPEAPVLTWETPPIFVMLEVAHYEIDLMGTASKE